VKSVLTLVSLVTIIALSGCAHLATPSALDREVVLAPGQTARIADASATLRFEGVERDSRCPADVVCITGGDALVRVTLDANSARATVELHTDNPAPARHQGLTITLIDLSPYPFSSRPIGPSDYRVTLTVSR